MNITAIFPRSVLLLALAAPSLFGTVVNVQLQEGNNQTAITANDNAIATAFTTYRNEASTIFNFPAGTYYVSKSISPSGLGNAPSNQATKGAAGKTLNFRATEFVFTGTPGTTDCVYNELRLYDGSAWHSLDFNVVPDADAPYDKTAVALPYDSKTVKPDLVDNVTGKFRDRWVAFDIRNSPGVTITGFLSLTRELPGGLVALPNDRLVAMASSGGDADTTFTGTSLKGSGMLGGTIDSLRIQNFSIGFFAEKFNAAGTKTIDAFKDVFVRRLIIQNAWRCFVIGNGNFANVRIHQMSVVGGATSYFYKAGTVNIGSCFLIDRIIGQVDLDGDGVADTAPDTDPAPNIDNSKRRPPHKFLEIVGDTTTFGGVYSRPAKESTFSTINVGKNATVTIGTLHNDLIDGTTSECVITMAKDDADHASGSGTLRILAVGARLDANQNLSDAVGIAAIPSIVEQRSIYVGAYELGSAFHPIEVIKDFRTGAIGGTSVSNDKIWTHTTQDLLFRKVNTGPTDPPPTPPASNFVSYPTRW